MMNPIDLVIFIITTGHNGKHVVNPGKGVHVNGSDELLFLEIVCLHRQDESNYLIPNSTFELIKNWIDKKMRFFLSRII